MDQTVLPPIRTPNPPKEVQIAELARRYIEARGTGMKLLSVIGGRAENVLDRLPGVVREQLDTATLRALEVAFDAAAKTRGTVPDTGHWLTRAMTAATGAAGGFGGLPSAMAELPVTTTVILRAIQGIAAEHGFDPNHEDTRAECLQVFAAAGPLEEDDGTDLSFLTLRATLTGTAMNKILATVAPKLAVVLGQKLATQAIPVIGAATGAAVNYTFTNYYQEMAQITFGLRRLSEQTGHDRAALIEEFRRALTKS